MEEKSEEKPRLNCWMCRDMYNMAAMKFLKAAVLFILFLFLFFIFIKEASVVKTSRDNSLLFKGLDALSKNIPLAKSQIETILEIKLDKADKKTPYFTVYTLKDGRWGEVEVRLSNTKKEGLVILQLDYPVSLSVIRQKYGEPAVNVNTPENPNKVTYSYKKKGYILSFESNGQSSDEIRTVVVDWVR